MKKRIGIIGIPGAWSSEILREELEKQGAVVSVFQVDDLVFDVIKNDATIQGESLRSFDAVVIKKLGKYAPRILDWLDVLSNIEDQGLKFFSSPKKLRDMISRIGCTRKLSAGNIPMPSTMLTENVQAAKAWIEQVNGAVFKPNFSTKARGMEVLKGSVDLAYLEKLKSEYGFLYLQELMELPGKDFGVVFSGDKYLGTYARVASKDAWNTTTADGGHYESFEPSSEIMDIAQRAQALFDLDFCCVDIAETPTGPIVFEVSAFGGFKGLFQGAGINSAAVLSEYVMQKIG